MDPKRTRKFRIEASARGLSIGDSHSREENAFLFDLNQGWIYAPAFDAEKIMELVLLAREVAERPGYGEHSALLNLVAERSVLESVPDHDIYWHRAYYVRANEDPEKWLSLKDWLISEGQDPDAALAEIEDSVSA